MKILAAVLMLSLAAPSQAPSRLVVRCPGGVCVVPEATMQALADEVQDLRRALDLQCAITRHTKTKWT